MATTDPIRNKKQLRDMAEYYLHRGQLRNFVLIVLGVFTVFRISDLLRLTWEDVYDFKRQVFRTHIVRIERKTGKKQIVALNSDAITALKLFFPHRQGTYIFTNYRSGDQPISRVQAYRIIRDAAKELGISGTISPHSMRKTFGYHAWKDGVSDVLLMDIYNHSSFEVTRRYLGITQDDRDNVHLSMKLF